jgi:L-serine dehydratase
VTLYGSLASTGKGHMTDYAIEQVAREHHAECEIGRRPEVLLPVHPNGLVITAEAGNVSETYYSIGGGKVVREGEDLRKNHIYPLSKMKDVFAWSEDTGGPLWEYAVAHEDDDLFD